MKKFNFIYSTFLLCAFACLFMGYRSNPPTGYTGSTGTTCDNCHGGANFGGSFSITGVPTTILPNTAYIVTVTLNKTSGTSGRAGFELNVVNGVGTKMGTLSLPGTGVGVTTSGTQQYVRHSTITSFVNTGVGSKSWTFTWTSPATTTNNNITFYASGVIADGADDTGNDEVANTTFAGTFTPSSTPLTVVELAKTNVTCLGGTNGTATVSASGGSGCTNSFLWSNGQTNATATGLAAGSYTVTATCGASTGTKTVTITQPTTALSATATGSLLTCTNLSSGTASVTPSGGGTTYTYLWSNAQTSASISGLTAGTYNVTVADNNGCTLVRSAIVSPPVNNLSVTTSSTAETCLTLGTATATPSGSTSYSYLWSNGNTTAQATGITGGTSPTVTVTDNNGCKSTSTVAVAANKTAPPSTISGGTTLTCAQNSTTLSAPSGAYTYNWSNGITNSTVTTSNTGNYVVTVTSSANGCTSSSSVNVTANNTPPTVAISGNQTLTCSSPSSSLSTSGGSAYVWSGPNGAASTSSNINATQAGAYSVTVTSSTNGCTGTASVNITSNISFPTVPNINPTNPTLTCSNQSVTLSSSAPAIYGHQWYLNNTFAGTGTQINATQAGTYKVVITDNTNGCTSEASTTVTSTNSPLTVMASGGKITCTNPSVTLTANAAGATTYRWVAAGFDVTAQSPTVTTSGTYTVIATASNGCTGSTQVSVSSDVQKPTVSATATGTLSCITPNVSLNATSSTPNLTYTWTSSSGFNASGSSVTTQQAGIVTVTATNSANGCSNTALVTVTSSNDKPIVATEGGAITCKDTIIAIKATVTGNTTGLTYKWSGPSSFTNTTAAANVKKSGDYVVTVTAGNGCSSIATAKVTLDNQTPNIEITAAKTFICDGDSIRLTAKSTATISSYTWSNASAKNEITATKSGIYSVIATSTNACKSTATLTLKAGEKPTISLLADSITCKKASVKITAKVTWQTPTTTAWTGANGFTSNTLEPDVTQKGTYKLKVTAADACAATAEIIVKENKTIPTVKIAGEFINCDSIPVVLLATSSAANFVWEGFGVANNTSTTVTATKSGKYVVTSTGSNGCVGKDSAEVKLFPAILASASTTVCTMGHSKPILLSVSGGKTPFALTDSSGVKITGNAIPFKPGLLPILVKDANGCQVKITSVSTALSLLTIDKNATVIKNATVGQNNGSITLAVNGDSPSLKYIWSTGQTTKNLNNVGAATYCVSITDALACQVTECFVVKTMVSTEDNLLARAITVYPNPVSDVLTISVAENTDIQYLMLMNDKGQLINRYDSVPSQLDLNTLPQGVYFLKIGNDKGECAMKRVSKL